MNQQLTSDPMQSNDETGPYRHDTHAAYERIAALEDELARLRGTLQSPQSRALASLRIDHLREDRADLITRFHRRRNALFVATGVGMTAAFAWFLVRAGVEPAAARDLWIACGAAVTAVAASGWLAQAVVYGRTLANCRSLDRRIAEEQVLAGLEPASVTTTRVRVEATSLDMNPVRTEPIIDETPNRAAAR